MLLIVQGDKINAYDGNVFLMPTKTLISYQEENKYHLFVVLNCYQNHNKSLRLRTFLADSLMILWVVD